MRLDVLVNAISGLLKCNHCDSFLSCGLTPELSRPARCDSAGPRPRSGLGLNELLGAYSQRLVDDINDHTVGYEMRPLKNRKPEAWK